MLKSFLAGATALAIAGGALCLCATVKHRGRRRRVPARASCARQRRGISAFGDARIAALHAGLKLTAEQEKLWPPVESVLRDLAKQRSERFAARANADRPKDPIERMNLRAEVMGQRAAGLKKLADAAGPLYKSLDDGQKRRFAALARLDRGQMRGHHGWQQHHRGMRGGMMDNDGGR